MTSTVGATPSSLDVLVELLGGDSDVLDDLARRTAWALEDLRQVSHEPSIVLVVPAVDRQLAGVAWSLGAIATDVASVAAALRAADRWDQARRRGEVVWRAGLTGVRAADQVATVGLHEVPGLGWLPAIEARAAAAQVWGVVRIVDETRRDRVGQVRTWAVETGRARVDAAASAGRGAFGGRGASALGRAADVLSSPAVRRVARAAGRAAAVVGIGADLVDAVDRGADGDGWGAARSVLSAAGGAAMFSPTPLAVVGATVVAGVYVYEHREAIADSAVHAWQTAGDLLGGGRALLDGLF